MRGRGGETKRTRGPTTALERLRIETGHKTEDSRLDCDGRLKDEEGPPLSSLSRIMTSSHIALGGPAWTPPLACERLPPFGEVDDTGNPKEACPSSANLSTTLLGEAVFVARRKPDQTISSPPSSSRASTSITSWVRIGGGNGATKVCVADMACYVVCLWLTGVVDDMKERV